MTLAPNIYFYTDLGDRQLPICPENYCSCLFARGPGRNKIATQRKRLLEEVLFPVTRRQNLGHSAKEARGVRAVDGAVVERERQHTDRMNGN